VPLIAFALARLREPSTYAGLGAVFAAAGIHADQAVVEAAVQVLVAVAGLVAVLMPEKSTGVRAP
jgi:hypothetical protein